MNNNKNHRRSIRLKGYDYSQQGLYFITLCIQNMARLMGEIRSEKMELNRAGEMIQQQWQELPIRFRSIKLHEFVVMPNHFHAILELVGVPLVGTQMPSGQLQNGHQQKGQPQGIAPTLGDVIGAFKSLSTNEYIHHVKNNHWPGFDKRLWQRNYYEHIIRNEESYLKISQYVQENPIKWHEDKYYV